MEHDALVAAAAAALRARAATAAGQQTVASDVSWPQKCPRPANSNKVPLRRRFVPRPWGCCASSIERPSEWQESAPLQVLLLLLLVFAGQQQWTQSWPASLACLSSALGVHPELNQHTKASENLVENYATASSS